MSPYKPSHDRKALQTLRERAEALLRARPADTPTLPTEDVQALVHELNVHQMELEIQNEELREAQDELSHARDEYADLYEFAPVGYVRLDKEGRILQANLTAATMLGVERQALIGATISKFVDRASQDVCYLHRCEVFSSETKHVCDVEMHKADGRRLAARLESIAFEAGDERCCRTAIIDVTAAQDAQQQLRESVQRYRRLTETLTDYVYHVRVDQGRAVETIHEANCEAVTGYTPQEFAANSLLWIAMVPEEDRAIVEEQVSRILSGQASPPIEHRIHRKDGQVRWVRHTVSAQRGDQGRLVAYDGLLRDITQRKDAEESLRQLNMELEQRVDVRTAELRQRTDQLARQSAEAEKREREFRMLAENVPALFSYVDCDQCYRYVNRRYEELFEKPSREVVGKTVKQLLGPERYGVVRSYVEKVLQGQAVEYNAEFNFADGNHFVHVRYVPDLDEERNVRGFFTLVTDVTELKRSEQQVKLLAEAIAHLGEGVVITDDELDWPGPRIRFVNEATCRITGYTADELIGQTPRILQGEATSREKMARLKADLSANRPCLVEITNYRKDGTSYDAEIFITPLFDAEGGRTNFVSIHRDVTERKRAEEALRREHELSEGIINSSQNIVLLLDTDGRIVRFNPYMEELTGWQLAEVRGRDWFDTFLPERNRERIREVFTRAVGGERTRGNVNEIITKDGRELEIDWHDAPLTSAGGKLIGLVSIGQDITERKQAAQAMQRSEAFARSVLASPVANVAVLNGEGCIVAVNPAWEQFALENCGEALAQASVGMNYLSICRSAQNAGDETAAHVIRGIHAVMNGTKQIFSLEYSCHSPTEKRWFQMTVTPAQMADGGVVVAHLPITERKEAEQRLRTSEERFRKVFEHAGIGIAITDRQGRFQQCNPAYCRFVGYSEDELLQLDFPSLVHPDDRAANLAEHRRLLAEELSFYEIENRYVHKDGHAVWARKFVSVFNDQSGNPANFVALVTDMTERRRAEQAVRDREERLRAVLNTASDTIVTIDQRGIITDVNPSSEQMFGYTQDELIGQNVKMLMPVPYCDEHDEFLARYVATGEARIIGSGREVVGRRKDGSTFPVDLAVSEVAHLGLFTGMVRDISDSKELQRQVLEIAAEEDRWIGHELHEGIQQEITAMELLAGTVRDALDGAEQREIEGMAARILAERDFLRSCEIADKLCKGLAGTHAHVQQLSRGILPVQIDAQGLKSALAELAASTEMLQNLKCRFESPEVVEVADTTTATHLYRIAQEAVNNALRHSQGSEIRISLVGQDGQLVLRVSDNGVGIDEAFSSRAGVPVRSIGIGLRAMHYRASLIGATLDVRRREGGGTQVTCTVLRGGRGSV